MGKKNKSDGKKETKQKIPPEGFIIVNTIEPWLKESIPEDFADKKLFRIILFYIIHSPCKGSSYSRSDLESFGWKNPWHSEVFRCSFDKIAGFNGEENCIYVTSQKEFEQKWIATGLQDDFYNISKEFAVFAYAGESNPRLDLLHHIRNALAHGRFSARKCDKGNDYFIIMEDVNDSSDFLKVNARIILKKSTLIKWINLLECRTEEAKKLCQDLLKINSKSGK